VVASWGVPRRPNPPKDLEPLIPMEDLKKVVSGLARVPKDAVAPIGGKRKKASAASASSPKQNR